MRKFLPKKLWLLRAYVAFLIGFIELLLSLYVLISIINLFSRETLLGDIVLGLAGLYLVTVSLSVLLVSQIILLFIGIHDNIDDMRKKALDQNYTVDLVAEKEKENSNIINSIFMITVIVLSILFSILSLTGVIKNNNSQTNTTTEKEIGNSEIEKLSYSVEELYPKLKKGFLDNGGFCEPIGRIEETKQDITVFSKEPDENFLSSWDWEVKDIIGKDINNDGELDFTIEVLNSGGGCGGQIGTSERWTLFGIKSNAFVMTHIIPYRSETGNWEELQVVNQNEVKANH